MHSVMADAEMTESEAVMWLFESDLGAADSEGALDWLSGIGGGAASGAATGVAGGPWGALIGGVIGGVLGALQTAASQRKPSTPARRAQTRATARPARTRSTATPAGPGGQAAAPASPAAGQLVQQIVQLLPEILRAFRGRAPTGEAWEELLEATPEALEMALETVLLDAWNETVVAEERPYAGSLMEQLPAIVPMLAELAPLLVSLGQIEAAQSAMWEGGDGYAEPTEAFDLELWQTPEWDGTAPENEPVAIDEPDSDEIFDIENGDEALDDAAAFHQDLS